MKIKSKLLSSSVYGGIIEKKQIQVIIFFILDNIPKKVTRLTVPFKEKNKMKTFNLIDTCEITVKY